MIPYDDLVVALASWRARQGLPIAAHLGAAVAARAAAPAAPAPRAASLTPRTAPRQAQVLDDDDAAVIEETRYDSDDDYVVPLGGEPESTAIGAVPQPGKRHDW
jgi:hypothetical protein